MNELKIPEQLRGAWHHVLILTYGANIPFFENALWSQFGARCRNKIILADGRQYLDACANYAQRGLVRSLNQRYIAEGISASRSAHAKAILLANSDRGRLLVGSGNLSWQGYASGGELFTRYDYDSEDLSALGAFLGFREFVDALVNLQFISPLVVKRINHLWEKTPWLFQSASDDQRPVRHNLHRSFLEQLQEAIGDSLVEELWVMSPFYDIDARALRHLLETLAPRKTTLLVQPRYTSVDPSALQRVLDRFSGHCQVRAFTLGEDSPYVHAKLYLLKLPNRAICLQGSPNLSQAAMLLANPRENIELANLLVGSRDEFDYLLDKLQIEPRAKTLDGLELRYKGTSTPAEQKEETWRLTGGEWADDRLHLRFQGTSPSLRSASLLIADHVFLLQIQRQESHSLELKLLPAAIDLLGRSVPVAIRVGERDETFTSNPVFVCNRAALDAVLEITEEDETLDRIGNLDLDDEEFERLLGELNAALMIDRRSVWQLAGRALPSGDDDNDEALRLDYADVDYEMLRQHPKIQQYMHRGTSGTGYARTRLQIILSAITDHFRDVLDVSSHADLIAEVTAKLEEGEAETEEEREQEEEEKEHRRRTYTQRIRRILKNFIKRYLKGIRSTDFQELAGFEVIVQNYVIFNHILWRLFFKEWVEPEFLVDSLLDTWAFFWGNESQEGYFRRLAEEQQTQALQFIQGDQHSDSVTLAALYISAHVARLERWADRSLALRDLWRELLRHPPFEIDADVLEQTCHIVSHLFPYQPPLPSAIVKELNRLASFETRSSFLRAFEQRHNYPRGSCAFDKQTVWRQSLDRDDRVDCLMLQAQDALLDRDTAIALLQGWVRFEKLDYYRIQARSTDNLAYFDIHDQAGLFWDKRQKKEHKIGPIAPCPADWDDAISRLAALAKQVDERLILVWDEPEAISAAQAPSTTTHQR